MTLKLEILVPGLNIDTNEALDEIVKDVTEMVASREGWGDLEVFAVVYEEDVELAPLMTTEEAVPENVCNAFLQPKPNDIN